MEKMKSKHFECIKEDNSEREYAKQWERSKIIFDHFYEWIVERVEDDEYYFSRHGDQERQEVRR